MFADPDASAYNKAAAARELATVARKAGDDSAVVEYLVVSVLTGAQPDVHKELEDVYKKTHNGSPDGLGAMLNERYRKGLPHIEAKPFERTRTKDSRVVLAELFTGAACPPCVGVDLACDAVLERCKPQDVALLVYHQHIPGPDPMALPQTDKRRKSCDVNGVPTYYLDGATKGPGGAGADQAARYFTTLTLAIERAMGEKPAAQVDLKATMTGSTIKVQAAASRITSKSPKLKLQVVLVEEQIRHSGPNGVRFHSMVVRRIAGPDGEGFAVPLAKGAKVGHAFDLAKIVAENRTSIDEFLSKPFSKSSDVKPSFTDGRRDDIDPKRLAVVAFLQDEDPVQGAAARPGFGVPLRRVLQTAYVKVQPAGKTTN